MVTIQLSTKYAEALYWFALSSTNPEGDNYVPESSAFGQCLSHIRSLLEDQID